MCGVFGISSPHHRDAARQVFFGLFALQHRGQEAAGIASGDGRRLHLHKGTGLVTRIFDESRMRTLPGHTAIGHTRYSTAGSSTPDHAQPFRIETVHGPLALAHNGNLTNATGLRAGLLARGVPLTTHSDSEVMTAMLAGAPGDGWMDRLAACMSRWEGAYSLVVLTLDGVYAARDPWGLRPLTIGQLPGGGYAVASETGALETVGCEAIREVGPGEIVALHREALIVRQALPPAEPLALCTFEHIYFSRPDSFWDGRNVYAVRLRLGDNLARECPVDADLVVPVPDSSIPAAIGYARASGLPLEMALVKNRYIGRTFIQPTQEMREHDVEMKFNPLGSVLRGKRVVLMDDSIVRGTTSRRLVRLLRQAGAAEVHFRVTCPPIIAPCFMGVDMPTREELIAASRSVDEIRRFMGADSLCFLSLQGMMDAIGRKTGYCNACFTARYPVKVDDGPRTTDPDDGRQTTSTNRLTD